MNNTLIFKPVSFLGSSYTDLAAFPDAARSVAGFELWQVQQGLMPADFKPMPTVGAGAYEIRIHAQGQWRVIYVAKHGDSVYVLHCFAKKTQQTAQSDIDLAAKRYRLMVQNLQTKD